MGLESYERMRLEKKCQLEIETTWVKPDLQELLGSILEAPDSVR